MKTTIAALALIVAPFAVAHADAPLKDEVRAGAVTHQGVVTQKIDALVPTMTTLSSPVAQSLARKSDTYTDVVGSLVPTMTSPDANE